MDHASVYQVRVLCDTQVEAKLCVSSPLDEHEKQLVEDNTVQQLHPHPMAA